MAGRNIPLRRAAWAFRGRRKRFVVFGICRQRTRPASWGKQRDGTSTKPDGQSIIITNQRSTNLENGLATLAVVLKHFGAIPMSSSA